MGWKGIALSLAEQGEGLPEGPEENVGFGGGGYPGTHIAQRLYQTRMDEVKETYLNEGTG